MKCIIIILICCICVSVKGQSIVKPRSLQVTVNKTSNLIFPAAIVSVDRGSDRIIVQKSTSNILRVKADTAFADTTNLSVITSDGRLYSFLISYHVSPDILNVDLGAGEMVTQDTALLAAVKTVLQLKNNLYGIRFSEGNVKLSITGIYTTSEILICKLRIENNSSLSFEIGQLRCRVTRANAGKRRPVQEAAAAPLMIQSAEMVREKQANTVVIVLPKVALGTKQVLQIDLSEKGGERHLSLRVPNKYILKATLLK